MPDEPIKLAIEALDGLFTSSTVYGGVAVWRLGGSYLPTQALAALRSIKPDCRTCEHFDTRDNYCVRTITRKRTDCTNGDKYQARPIVQLYLKE
jgi:hypothetical protein